MNFQGVVLGARLVSGAVKMNPKAALASLGLAAGAAGLANRWSHALYHRMYEMDERLGRHGKKAAGPVADPEPPKPAPRATPARSAKAPYRISDAELERRMKALAAARAREADEAALRPAEKVAKISPTPPAKRPVPVVDAELGRRSAAVAAVRARKAEMATERWRHSDPLIHARLLDTCRDRTRTPAMAALAFEDALWRLAEQPHPYKPVPPIPVRPVQITEGTTYLSSDFGPIGTLVSAQVRTTVFKGRWAAIDGSNFRSPGAKGPSLYLLRQAIEQVVARGMRPMVFFDHPIYQQIRRTKRQSTEAILAEHLGVPESSIQIARKGTPADTWIIQFAQAENAVVVTNDHFRDRPEAQGLDALRVQIINGRTYLG